MDSAAWIGGPDVSDEPGGLALALFLVFLLVVLWPLVVLIFLPAVFLLLGVIAALAVLSARLASLAAWRVKVRNAETQLIWRVRGTSRAARAVRQVTAALERGDEPLIDGSGPDAVEPTRV